MRDDNIGEFVRWRENLGDDDLLHAFRAIKALETVKFELTLREEGFLDQIEAAVERF